MPTGSTIIINTQNFPPKAGGIQTYMFELAAALNALGENVRVIYDGPKLSEDRDFDIGLPFLIKRVRGPKLLRRYNKAREVLSQLKSEHRAILICDSWKSLEYVATTSCNNTLGICIAHGMEYPENPSSKRHLRIENVLKKADLILANSKFTAQRVRPYVTADRDIGILLPGASLPSEPSQTEFDAVDRWIGDHSPSLVTVGRLEPRKGQDKLIEILPRLKVDYPQLRYLIAGSGNILDELKSRAKELGVENNVVFCGHVSDGERTALLRKADIFAMPCRAVGNSVEGFGIVYIEAALQGTPSLAGRVGGAGDAVIHQETGWLCDGDSEADIYQTLRQMLDNKHVVAELGARAKERALAKFLWPQVAQNLLNMCIATRK